MYLENCDTVLPMKTQTMVVSKNESGMAGPAFRAIIGNANSMLAAGAMCVTPWNTSSGRPSALRRSCGPASGFVASAVTGDLLGNAGSIVTCWHAARKPAGLLDASLDRRTPVQAYFESQPVANSRGSGMKEIKAAIIGTGAAGRFHLQAYNKCPHTHVTAVCGGNLERAQALGKEFDVHAYISIEEMLRKERPDVVTVATLEWDHERPVLLSLEAGCHVLCEKVMAHTIAIGENMVAAAKRAGRTLGVNYNYRCVPSHGVIKEELNRGAFGEPALFTANMHAYLWAHLLDLLRFFFGDPVQVCAAMVDDQQRRPPATANSGRAWMYASEMIYHPSVALSASF